MCQRKAKVKTIGIVHNSILSKLTVENLIVGQCQTVQRVSIM